MLSAEAILAHSKWQEVDTRFARAFRVVRSTVEVRLRLHVRTEEEGTVSTLRMYSGTYIGRLK